MKIRKGPPQKKRLLPRTYTRQKKEKAAVIEYLRATPIIQIACVKAGIARSTFYRWRRSDRRFDVDADEAIEEGRSLTCDMAESVIIKGIQNSDMGAAKYFLGHNDPRYDAKRKALPRDDSPVIYIDT